MKFSHPGQGHALVHTDDLRLVDRPVQSGDVVRRGDLAPESGTVLNLTYKTCLATVTKAPSAENDPKFIDIGPDGPAKGDYTPSLHSIPLSELQDCVPFRKGDYVIVDQRLGIIEKVSYEYVIQLTSGNIIMIPHDSNDYDLSEMFQIPAILPIESEVHVEEQRSTPVSVKLGPNQIDHRLVDPYELIPGQYVLILPEKALKYATWMMGDYSDDDIGPHGLVEGNIVSMVPSFYQVRWICTNLFESRSPRCPKTLTTCFDAETFDMISRKVKSSHMSLDTATSEAINLDPQVLLDKRVMFKDFDAANEKYENLQRDPDILNVFQIVDVVQTVATVQWQDGTVSSVQTEDLWPGPYLYSNVGFDIMPGSLVLDAEDMEKIEIENVDAPVPNFLVRSFPKEYMSPSRVGVLQGYRMEDCTAEVRWFKDSDVKVYHNDSILSLASSFGELDKEICRVSLFKLRQIPALKRTVGDFVIFSPPRMHKNLLPNPLPDISTDFSYEGACHLSYLLPLKLSFMNEYMRLLKERLPSLGWFRELTEIDDSTTDDASLPPEFVGQIVSCNSDGTVTILMLGGDDDRYIDIRHEQILLVLDEESTSPYFWTDDLREETPGSASDSSSEEFEEEWTIKGLLEGLPDEAYNDAAAPAQLTEASQTDAPTDSLSHELGSAVASTISSSDVLTTRKLVFSGDGQDDVQATSGQTEAEGNPSLTSPGDEATPSGEARNVIIPTVCPDAFAVLDEVPAHDHHFLGEPQDLSATNSRLRREYEILRTSLPPNIFVRTWESRMDLMRVLIMGSPDTPYELAPFVFDIYLGEFFPGVPPKVRFHHWGIADGALNPNILQGGGICLSLLGTWDGARESENWSSSRSTILQLVVSLSALVLVKLPYYSTFSFLLPLLSLENHDSQFTTDEAGYEAYNAYGLRYPDAREYNENVYLAAQQYIIYTAEHEIPGVEDILTWFYMRDLDADSDSDDNQLDRSRLPNYLHKAVTKLASVIDHHNNTIGKAATVEVETGILEGDDAATPFLDRMSVWGMKDLQSRYLKLRELEEKLVAELKFLRDSVG